MNNQKTKRKQFLAGHKRIGKRILPPMMQIKNLQFTSYVDNLLPELIWIGLLNQKFGYLMASRILESLFLEIEKIEDSKVTGNFALASTYNFLSYNQKSQLHEACRRNDILEFIQDAIAPLVLIYDSCPLLFFGPPPKLIPESNLVSALEKCVSDVIDRYNTPGVALYTSILFYRLITKKIHFPADMKLPDFNMIYKNINSDEGKHAAGFVRSNALAEFGYLNIDPLWANTFWNRNLEISSCRFDDGDEDV